MHLDQRTGRIVLVLAVLSSLPRTASGGAEQVLVVVNRNSWASRTIANHYIHLRQVPDGNVLFLDYRGPVDVLGIDDFHSSILDPIRREVKRRRLTDQIRFIAYAPDFPYAIDYSNRLADPGRPAPASAKHDVSQFPQGSLTGLTFLHEQLGVRGLNFTELDANDYAIAGLTGGQTLGIQRFLAKKATVRRGDLVPFPLATYLGYAAGRGNSISEIVTYLRRAAMADGSHPDGVFYFMRNPDIRSQVRAPLFDQVVTVLRSVGLKAEIQDGIVPPENTRVTGAVLGSSDFVWGPTCRIVPGAICENFTSYGGILRENASQTPLSELLRQGAAGTTGTVIEPFAIHHKFPHPALQAHYVQGCCMAEAVYQSVLSPYQLLVVGDPLCRPWNVAPRVGLRGLPDDPVVRDSLSLTAEVVSPPGFEVREIAWHVDGRFVSRAPISQPWKFDSTKLDDGHHLITAVALAGSAIGHEGRHTQAVTVRNRSATIACEYAGTRPVRFGETAIVQLRSSGCSNLEIWSQGLKLASVAEGQGIVRIPTNELGQGPILVSARGKIEGEQRLIHSAPCPIEILPPNVLRGMTRSRPVAAQAGVRLVRSDKTSSLVTLTVPATWPSEQGIVPRGRFEVSGTFEAREADLYQFRAELDGTVRVTLDGRGIYSGPASGVQYGVPVHLGKGTHDLRCTVQLAGDPQATLSFGNQGTQALGQKLFYSLP